MKRVHRSDLRLIAALLLMGLILFTLTLRARPEGRCAVLRVNGQEVARLPLTENQRYPIEIDNVLINMLCIKDGAVRMEKAYCPDHLCIRRGAIRHAGDSIVCLPNRVVVVISGEDALDLDAVAG